MILYRIIRKAKRIFGFDLSRINVDRQSKLKKSKNLIIENSTIVLTNNAVLNIGHNVKILNCNIWIDSSNLTIENNVQLTNVTIGSNNNSKISLHDFVQVNNYEINVDNGSLTIMEDTRLFKGRNALIPQISISNGSLDFDVKNIIKADFSIRFGGTCKIGKYNCINENTEIRCDENITIGDFNMISYECNIWDTNTHCIYNKNKRREMTINNFPIIGQEIEKPNTKPIIIGNDTWIGKKATLLKGTEIQDGGIIGINALVSSKVVPFNSIAIGNPSIIKHK